MNQLENAPGSFELELLTALDASDYNRLSEIEELLCGAWADKKSIFVIGCGGCTDAADLMAGELTNSCAVLGRTGFKTVALGCLRCVQAGSSDDSLTEVDALVRLKILAKHGDILIAFCAEDGTEALRRALETAREAGIVPICFTGSDGGEVTVPGDVVLSVPSGSAGLTGDILVFYIRMLSRTLQARLAGMFGIEIIRRPVRRLPKVALFDFDGTISLIREGWQDIMTPYFTDVLMEAPDHENRAECERVVLDFVTNLTGKQTIFQCMQLDEEVIKRGGKHVEPLEYKKEYLRRLLERIKSRHEALRSGSDPVLYLVTGVTDMLETLRQNGLMLYLASGTDESDVLEEARLLRIDGYFDGGVYGARDDMIDCSKELVIRKIILENGLKGEDIVSFGDGYVEIELVKNIGGYSFGVATDECRNFGINAWKRERLSAAGADCIIPNFERADEIIALLKEEF